MAGDAGAWAGCGLPERRHCFRRDSPSLTPTRRQGQHARRVVIPRSDAVAARADLPGRSEQRLFQGIPARTASVYAAAHILIAVPHGWYPDLLAEGPHQRSLGKLKPRNGAVTGYRSMPPSASPRRSDEVMVVVPRSQTAKFIGGT